MRARAHGDAVGPVLGFVIGGTHPAALAADWLTSAWDQNAVCVSFGSDERTETVVRALLADGTSWISGSRWRGRAVLRISVSNWSTTDDDVERSLAALRSEARS